MKLLKSTLLKISIALLMCISVTLPYTLIVSASEGSYKASVLIDANTLKVLSSKNKDMILPQASVTKLMTYLVVMDTLKSSSIPLNKKVVVDIDLSVIPADGSKINLKKGDTLTINQLIESLLIVSANDSALVLEKMVSDITKKDFINLMNEKAKELGLNKTNFINTSGLTEKDKGYNTTTAYEIAILSKDIIDSYPETLKITSKKSFTFNGVTYPSTNKLLSKGIGVDGMKTGFTNEAGYCLSSTVNIKASKKDEKPFRVIAVTLGSPSEEKRTQGQLALLNSAMNNYWNKRIINKEETFKMESKYHVGGVIEAVPSKDEFRLINKKTKVETKTTLKEKIRGKVKKGDKVGTVTAYFDNTSVEADLIAKEDVKGVNVFKRIQLFFEDLF
ncbi:MAG: D-alanyl-D-alanine carboxypeptidase family protein [Clostridium sp.]